MPFDVTAAAPRHSTTPTTGRSTMTMRTIFVPWWAGSASDAPLETALAVTRRAEAHLDVVYVQRSEAQVATSLRAAAIGHAVTPEQVAQRGRLATGEARDRFASWRERHVLPDKIVGGQTHSVFSRWSERTGLPEQVIVRKGRISDLTVLAFPDLGGGLDRPLDAALFETGRPVLLAPAAGGTEPLRHVMIAWNGSIEATRAVAGALPLLRRAERVTVLMTVGLADQAFTNDPVAADLDLADTLSWHGIEARYGHVAADAESTASSLVQAAAERDAILLVMSVYTHSRVTAASLGGVTGRVLCDPLGFPVLMGH